MSVSRIFKRLLARPMTRPMKKTPTPVSGENQTQASNADPAPTELKPKWQRLTDRHLDIGMLPPDDALPLIRLAYFQELSEPFEERAQKRDAIFHTLIGDFSRLDTRYANLRDKLPATPLEIRFYRKDADHDPRRPS